MTASGAASLGLAGVRVRIYSKVCTMCTPSRFPTPPAHFTMRRSSCKAGADHQAKWAGAWEGGGSELQVLERWWRGLGVDDAYGQRGAQQPRWRSQGEDTWTWDGGGGGLGWRMRTGGARNRKLSGVRGGRKA